MYNVHCTYMHHIMLFLVMVFEPAHCSVTFAYLRIAMKPESLDCATMLPHSGENTAWVFIYVLYDLIASAHSHH